MHWFHRSRHGEAANPGPAAPGTPLCGERPRQRSLSPRSPRPAQVSGMDVDGRGPHSGSRVFCPVPGCPCSVPSHTRGWCSVTTMQSHVGAHMAGTLAGAIPAAWLQQHGRQRCAVCGLSVSSRFGVHPTCHPEARAAAAGRTMQLRAGMGSRPLRQSRGATHRPYDMCRKQPGTPGAKPSPGLWQRWRTRTRTAHGENF